jgi:arylsulfatase A-like enzyme
MKPNILLLTLDTLRADMLSCYGYKAGLTPNMDRLAETGVRFEQAITGGSWTQAAFPTILTSTYASMYGGCLGALAMERPSPIRSLTQNGYATAGFVTSPLLGRSYGYDQGFQHFVELSPGESDPKLRQMKGGEKLLRYPLTHRIGRLLGKQTRPAKLYATAEELTAHFSKWVAGIHAPFFAWLHYMDIHWPYHQEETLKSAGEIAQAWQDLGHLHRLNRKGATLSNEQKARYVALYEEAVHYTDEQIGKLMWVLDEHGLGENTVIIVVADHGEEFMERNRWGHFEMNLHDEIVRVPLIISLPKGQGGKVVERQVRTLDLMPTVLDLCDVGAPTGMLGESLTPLWTNVGAYGATEAISERWRNDQHVIAIRTERFKYIWDKNNPRKSKLFDLRFDAQEEHNVIANYRQEAREFEDSLHEFLQKVVQTTPDQSVSEPELDETVIKRLRDLGYVS